MRALLPSGYHNKIMRFGVGFKLIEAMWNKAGVSNAQKKEKRRMLQAYHFIRAKLN